MVRKDKSIGAAFCDDAAIISHSKKVGIICAMDVEAKDLIDSLRGASYDERNGYTFYEGMLENTPVVIVKCGVGKVNAARGTQMMIDLYRPSVIINSGVAGGLADGLSVGDIIVGTEFVQHDVDVTALGYAKGYLCTGTEPDRPTVFSADPAVTELLVRTAEANAEGRTVREGRIASGDQFVGTPEKKAEIRKEFGADAAEMEGAAVAQTACSAGLPFAALRVVSDLADGTDAGSYDEFEEAAAHISADIIREFSRNALD
jgi:adenosylhomocysteine nucleosidase